MIDTAVTTNYLLHGWVCLLLNAGRQNFIFCERGMNMLRSMTNVIFGFVGGICLLVGLFWIWFMYEFSLKWAKYEGNLPPSAGGIVVFGTEGAWWIGFIAGGWIVLAVIFWLIQRRVNRKGAGDRGLEVEG